MQLPRKNRMLAAIGTSTLGLLGASTLFVPGAGAALPAASTFAFTGAAQTYTVPSNVCGVSIVAAGAMGGTWTMETEGESTGLDGGFGGTATAAITVTPGETLQVNVGGMGGNGTDAGPGAGGWNGGGNGGGTVEGPETDGGGGGGGGGASDVRQGGTGLGDRVVIGGGGGGVGVDSDASNAEDGFGVPGVGGNPATAGTGEEDGPGYTGATGGGAGTDSAGGAAGTGAEEESEGTTIEADGHAGALGIGGDGGSPLEGDAFGGGGGGGGLYGGGGGGVGIKNFDGAGGGGSSLGDTTVAGNNRGAGSVRITPTTECATPTTPPTPKPVETKADNTTAEPAAPVAAKPDYTG